MKTTKIISRLPNAIKKVVALQCSITMDVVYDSDAAVKQNLARARRIGANTDLNSIDDTSETVTGSIAQVFRYIYMSPYQKITNKDFTSGIEYESGCELEISQSELTKITPAEFTEFVNWMGESYPDFVNGIEDNSELAKFYIKTAG